jgi:predicted ATP-dependent Lon-type protease
VVGLVTLGGATSALLVLKLAELMAALGVAIDAEARFTARTTSTNTAIVAVEIFSLFFIYFTSNPYVDWFILGNP